MSLFTKPLSQLETADLQELVKEKAVENVRLEFKSQIPSKEDTLKNVSSFANTFGGFMVIGATADSTDGRIKDLPGVDKQAGYKQTLVQWCFGEASPPLTVEVSDPIPAPADNGKVCYVVYVAESDVAPHFLNRRKGIWVRTDEFSARFEAHLANEHELRHLFDRRKLVREQRARLLDRARRRFDIYAAKKHTDLSGNIAKLGSRLEFCLVPRFPARQLCEEELLKAHIQKSLTSWRQVMFPDPGSPILSQHESAIVLNAARGTSMFEVNVWGMLFYGTRIDEDHNGTSGIHIYQFVGYLLLFIQHAGKMLQMLGHSGPIFIETSLASILGTPWLYPTNRAWLSTVPGSELDDDVTFSITITSEELRERPDGVAMDVLRYILFSVNCAHLADSSQKLAELIGFGYGYNCWPQPDKLRV